MVAAARSTIYTGPGMKSYLAGLGVPVQQCVRERHTGHYHTQFFVPLGGDGAISHKHAVRPASEYADLIREKLRQPVQIIDSAETVTSWRDDPADHVRYFAEVTFALGQGDAESKPAPTSVCPPFNSAAVKIVSGAWNLGASHRAIDLARELAKANLWDGQAEISFHDPQTLHNRVFGVERLPIESLMLGTDYEIVGITAPAPQLDPPLHLWGGVGGGVILCLPAPKPAPTPQQAISPLQVGEGPGMRLFSPQSRAYSNHICPAVLCLPAPASPHRYGGTVGGIALLPATIPNREPALAVAPALLPSALAIQPAPAISPSPCSERGSGGEVYHIGDLVRVPCASYYRKIVAVHHYESVFYEFETGATFSSGASVNLRCSEEAVIRANQVAGIAH